MSLSAGQVKVVVLGGSAVGTPALIDALRAVPFPADQPRTPIALVLHGRTPEKLQPVAHVAQTLAAGCDWLTVSAETDLEAALDGAHFIVNQVRIGGLAARAFDETFPIPLGIPGEETVGPGGFANALRTVPQVVALARKIERIAPNALLLSFTNPASVIQYAVSQTTGLRVIGLCDASVTMTEQAAAALGVEPAALSIDYVGMHHFSFITGVRRAGIDVTAEMLAGLDRVPGFGLDRELVRALGALPTPYFRYFTQVDAILEKQKSQEHSRAEQLMALETELLAEYAVAETRPTGLAKRSAKWYSAIIAPVLITLIEKRSALHIVNIRNGETIQWLPPDAIIETPVLFEQGGHLRPLAVIPPSGELQARIQLNCAYEQLMVAAILEQSYAKALRALTLNPMVPSVSHARAILDRVWPDGDPARIQRQL